MSVAGGSESTSESDTQTDNSKPKRRQPRLSRPDRSRIKESNAMRTRMRTRSSSTPSRNRRKISSSTSSSTLSEKQPFDVKLLTEEQSSNINAPYLDLTMEKTEKIMADAGKTVVTTKDLIQLPITYPHVQTLSLDDLFPSIQNISISKLFNSNQQFRDELKGAIRYDIFTNEPQNQQLPEKVKDILLHPDSSLQGSWTQQITQTKMQIQTQIQTQTNLSSTTLVMPRLTQVLSTYLGSDNAPTGEEFMSAIARLCNPSIPNSTSTISSSYHWIDIIGIKNRKITHSWHQDTAIHCEKKNIYTVMLGFPPTNDYSGTGVFSHVVKLKYPRIRHDPTTEKNEESISPPKTMLAGDPVLYTDDIPSKYIIRPTYEPGHEILFYKDVDVLHSAPDVAYRSSVMRFMNIG